MNIRNGDQQMLGVAPDRERRTRVLIATVPNQPEPAPDEVMPDEVMLGAAAA
jgi:hypothetical protein